MLRWFLAAALLCAPSKAVSLSVAPLLLDVTAPSAATVLTLRNEQGRRIDVQLRVFRWEQVNGEDKLTPTQDVVVSPPVVGLLPGAEQVVRVLRVGKRPVSGEESYRVLIDELPDSAHRRDGRVKILLRHSLPVFFAEPNLSHARVSWSLLQQGDAWFLEGVNAGSRRLRMANLAIKDASGRSLVQRSGLLGYVLPGTTARWPLGSVRNLKANGTAFLTADTESGPINATAPIRAAR